MGLVPYRVPGGTKEDTPAEATKARESSCPRGRLPFGWLGRRKVEDHGVVDLYAKRDEAIERYRRRHGLP